jgi:hypothetical protein
MQKEEPGREPRAGDFLGILECELVRRETLQDVTDDADGFLDLGRQGRSRDPTPSEFKLAIANVVVAAENRADVMLQITAEMERESAGRIRDSGHDAPDQLFVGEKNQLSFERLELAKEHGLDPRGEAHMVPVMCGRTISSSAARRKERQRLAPSPLK